MSTGCIGLAIGRNVWQDKNPLQITRELKKIIWKSKK
jgi:DhnA family fructose-bisphosphate aldolase class Ia